MAVSSRRAQGGANESEESKDKKKNALKRRLAQGDIVPVDEEFDDLYSHHTGDSAGSTAAPSRERTLGSSAVPTPAGTPRNR